MKGSRENRSSRGATARLRKTVESEAPNGGSSDDFITVQCPVCGKTYTVQRSRAGKDGRCSCGTVFPIAEFSALGSDEPSRRQPPRTDRFIDEERHERVERQEAEDRVQGETPAPAQPGETADRFQETDVDAIKAFEREVAEKAKREAHKDTDVIEVRVGCIGRGHAGKTALLRALGERTVGDFLPSGLHVDAGDPREVAQMIRETEQAQRLLHQFGLPPTLEPAQIRYFLYEGADPRAVYKMREVIGQVLTHTLPDSAADQQARYHDYLRSLVNTHVLWAMVPCPAVNPTPHDRRRYANDLRITLAYVREALKLRSLAQPVAVALILSKMDALFANADEARAALTDDVLRDSFGPLVHLLHKSPQVGEAVIVPVTIFGFGNAVLRDEGDGRHGTPPGMDDEPFGPEPIWLLREGTSVEPYNLDTLFLWTLLAGLISQADPATMDQTEIGELCRTLGEDLRSIDPWMLALKGDSTAMLHALEAHAG